MKTHPTLTLEKELWSQGTTVIGVDEVGRGCLAGPLYVCASYFEPTATEANITYLESLGINDSKKLSSAKRSLLYAILQKENFQYAIGITEPEEIDTHGLTKAVLLATQRALAPLLPLVDHSKLMVLYDGSLLHPFPHIQHKTIIRGDSISLTIAASSILAKVERDTHMSKLAVGYPEYNWASNKGYGTLDHRTAIKQFGPSSHHRKLFLRKIS